MSAVHRPAMSGLRIIGPGNLDPTEGMGTLIPVVPDTFRIESLHGYGSPGELLTFELGPDGTLTWLGKSGDTSFVVDPLFTAQEGDICINGQIVGNTINFTCVDTGQSSSGLVEEASYVLTKQ